LFCDLQIQYWKYFAPWLYSVSSIILGILGIISACLGGKSSYLYMLLNFLVFGLVIEPIVMGAQECQGACQTCAPACPACCRDNSCTCDYIQFLFFSFGALMQFGSIFFGCSLIQSEGSRWDDSSGRIGEDGAPYLKFEGSAYASPAGSPPLSHLRIFVFSMGFMSFSC
jgi:hypothetical protein